MPVARRADHSSTSSTAPAANSFHLLDEIEQSLALDVTPASWPIGVGRDLLSTYDLFSDAVCSGANFCRSRCPQKLHEEVEAAPDHVRGAARVVGFVFYAR